MLKTYFSTNVLFIWDDIRGFKSFSKIFIKTPIFNYTESANWYLEWICNARVILQSNFKNPLVLYWVTLR